MDQNTQQDLFESVNSPEAPVKSLVTVGEQQTESSKMDDQEPAPVSVTSPIISVDDEADGINKEISLVNEESKPIGEKSPSEMNGNSPPRLEVTPPKIHISPEAGGDQERVKTGIGRPASSSLSPSRIPSRKNSSSIQTASGQSEAVNDDLKVLESRLERFVTRSSEGSEASDNSDLSGELGEGDLRADILKSHVSGSGGAASVTNRLYSSGTVSSRAKSGDSGGGNSPPEKGGGGSMLRNTLRKMTMFSIGDKKKAEQSEDKFTKPAPPPDTKSRSRAPFLGKSRVPKSQSPGPSSINRSKSFKEPGNSVSNVPRPTSGPASGLTRNNVYTSSLRRTKIKNQNPENQPDSGREPRGTCQFQNKLSFTTHMKRFITTDEYKRAQWQKSLRRENSVLLKRSKRLSYKGSI